MGLFSTIFGSSEVISKGTDALISAGDKLVYTDEEKADMKMKAIKLHIELLEASHPFKLTQRVLAFWFSFLFGISFIMGTLIAIANTVIEYRFKSEELKPGVFTEPSLFNLDHILRVVDTFDIFYIIAIIVSFYFGGGAIESLKRTFTKK